MDGIEVGPMRLLSVSLSLLLMAFADVAGAQTAGPAISLDGQFVVAGQLVFAGYQQQVPCGGFGTPPCPPGGAVTAAPRERDGEYYFNQAKYLDGQRRHAEALPLLMKSAEMGYEKAEYALGMDYKNGNGVPQDTKKAEYWLGLAAGQGSVTSQNEMGQLDPAKKIYYLQMAAAKHDPQAEYNLGMDYEFGLGVPHDRAKAMQYLREASRYGGNRDGDEIAAILAKAAPAKRFASQGQLEGMMPPAPFNAVTYRPQGCPAWYDSHYSGSKASEVSYSRTFCLAHPNCIVDLVGYGQVTCNGDQTPVTYRQY